MQAQFSRALKMLTCTCTVGAARRVIALLALSTIFPLPCGAQYFVLTNLESKQVEFELSVVPRGTSDRLFQRASKKLVEAGFSGAVSGGFRSEQFGPRLVLSLEVKDLGEEGVLPFLGKTCPGKKIYMQKLELWENFVIKRNPEQ